MTLSDMNVLEVELPAQKKRRIGVGHQIIVAYHTGFSLGSFCDGASSLLCGVRGIKERDGKVVLGVQPAVHVVLNVERQLFPLRLRLHVILVEEIRRHCSEVHLPTIIAHIKYFRFDSSPAQVAHYHFDDV